MRIFISFLLFNMVFLTSCSSDGQSLISQDIPTVRNNSFYDVNIVEDVLYARGLSHQSINGSNSNIVDLMLDVYYPENNSFNRPVYLFIHGGGLIMGDKQSGILPDIANYYASRGWVFISINYRLRDDFGTVPEEWQDFSNTLPLGASTQVLAMYPAIRDSKAALRWLAANSASFGINMEYLTVGGGSAGALLAIAASYSEPMDFRDELSLNEDVTLSDTNMTESFRVKTVIDFWGSKSGLDAYKMVYGFSRFDSSDPAMLIAHGTNDTTVPFSMAEDLKETCETNSISYAFNPLEGFGHSAWNATVNGKSLEELVFDFIVENQNIRVE